MLHPQSSGKMQFSRSQKSPTFLTGFPMVHVHSVQEAAFRGPREDRLLVQDPKQPSAVCVQVHCTASALRLGGGGYISSDYSMSSIVQFACREEDLAFSGRRTLHSRYVTRDYCTKGGS